MVIAFANLFGMGGAPLCSIERGRGRIEEAEKIMGNSFTMMVISGVLLTAFGLIFKRPMLYLFGARIPPGRLPTLISRFICSAVFLLWWVLG